MIFNMISTHLHNLFFVNVRLKALTLAVSLVVWMVLLGQRGTVVTREITLGFVMSSNQQVDHQVKTVEARIKGTRMALNKLSKNPTQLDVDVTAYAPGLRRVRLDPGDINLPLGATILSFQPQYVKVLVRRSYESEDQKFKKANGNKK